MKMLIKKMFAVVAGLLIGLTVSMALSAALEASTSDFLGAQERFRQMGGNIII